MYSYSATISIAELRKSIYILKVRVLGSAHCQTYYLNDGSARQQYSDITIHPIQPSKTYQIYYYSATNEFIGNLEISGQEMLSSPNKIVNEGLKTAKECESRREKKLPAKTPTDITALSDKIENFDANAPGRLEHLSDLFEDYLKCQQTFPGGLLAKARINSSIVTLLKGNPDLGFAIFDEFETHFKNMKSWDNMDSLITAVKDFSLKMFECWRRISTHSYSGALKTEFLDSLYETVGDNRLTSNADYLSLVGMVDIITQTIENIDKVKTQPYTYYNYR